MPDYFSHAILAEQIYDALPSGTRAAIKSKELYLLGAEGGDIFFFYRPLLSKNNPGKGLHALNARELFEKLLEGDISYAAGFATHYAADSTLHPAVYGFCRGKKKMFLHQLFEDDLGLYISRKYGVRRTLMTRDKMLSCTYPIYESASLVNEQFTLRGVEKAIKGYYLYCKFLFKHKKNAYRNDFDFSSLSSLCDDAVALGIRAVESVCRGEVDGEVFSRKFLEGKTAE